MTMDRARIVALENTIDELRAQLGRTPCHVSTCGNDGRYLEPGPGRELRCGIHASSEAKRLIDLPAPAAQSNPLDRACPSCGAAAGEDCYEDTPRRFWPRGSWHVARVQP